MDVEKHTGHWTDVKNANTNKKYVRSSQCPFGGLILLSFKSVEVLPLSSIGAGVSPNSTKHLSIYLI